MGTDSVNHLPEAAPKEVNSAKDVSLGVSNSGHSDTNDRAKTRPDKGRTHITHCGLLSRDIVRAVVRSGESLRNLRRYEKEYRAVFQPRGALAELLFDRWWSCYLRLHLLAKFEANLPATENSQYGRADVAELREGILPTLLTTTDSDEFEDAENPDFPRYLFRQLALVPRYDAHFAREMNQMASLLLMMRKSGDAALTR